MPSVLHFFMYTRLSPLSSIVPLKPHRIGDTWKETGQFTFGYNNREINFSVVIVFKIRKQQISSQGPKDSNCPIGGFIVKPAVRRNHH